MFQIPTIIAKQILNNSSIITRCLTSFSPDSIGSRWIQDIFSTAAYTLQRASYEDIRTYQAAAIAKLLYLSGFSKNEKDVLQKLREIPITQRSLINEKYETEKLARKQFPSYELRTSGSTGKAMGFFVDRQVFAERAIAINYWLYFLTGTINNRIMRIAYGDMPWSKYQGKYISYQANCGELLNEFKIYSPNILYGTVSRIYLLAERMRELGITHHFDIILTRSESLPPKIRTELEKFFQGKAYNIYAAREFGPIGQECTMQNGFHINEDRFYIEIVDDNYVSLPPGNSGQIIITALHNLQFSFIRYAIGDKGRVTYEPCECGLTTARLFFDGRLCDFLILPNQKRFPASDLLAVVNELRGIDAFQIIQISKESLELKIIARNQRMKSVIESQLRHSFASFFKSRLQWSPAINIEFVKTIPLSENGKRKVFIPLTGNYFPIAIE